MTDTQDHLADLAKAMAEVDRCTMQLVVDELGEGWPVLVAAEGEAAEALREAGAALEDPQRAIAALGEEIARAETELSTWRRQLEDGDVAARVTARTWISEWETELAALAQKREFAEAQMFPFIDARNKARSHLELVQGAKRGLAYAMADPYGRVGQGTKAYVQFRQTRLTYVLLMGDRAHPEWDCAISELKELCVAVMRVGHDITADLPSFGEVAFRAMTNAVEGNLSDVMSDPGPNAADVMASLKSEFTSANLTPAVIEDRRVAPPPPRAVREYMQTQRLSDLGLG